MNKIIIYILGLILFISCNFDKRPKEYTLTLVETSDIHGAIFDYDFVKDRKTRGSLSRIQTYLKNLRDTSNVVLLDNGDILQGQPTVYYYNYESTNEPHLYAQVMNYMQYDVATVGNHDIETGHDVYDRVKKEINFPWLAANAINIKTGEPYFEPYIVMNKNGIRIAVLGLITPGIPKWVPEKLWEGIEFEDMLVAAKKWIPLIKSKEKPDLIIGLFHAGYDYTYENADYNTPKNENASLIVAEQIPGFDIVFIGHDHKTWNKTIKNIEGDNVYILGPTSSGREVAQATVHLKLNKEGIYDKKIIGNIIEMKNYEADNEFNKTFAKQFNAIKNYVSRKVGTLNNSLSTFDAIIGPSMFTDFINNVQLQITDADISFTAPLAFNSKIEEGSIHVRDMFNLYRYENFLYTIELTGKEIDSYLEYSCSNWFNTMQTDKDHLLLFEKDAKGKPKYSKRYNSYALKYNYYNFDVAAGIKYIVDITKPNGDKVEILSMTNGNKFYSDSTYSVAINSYRGNGGGGHLIEGAQIPYYQLKKRIINSTDKDLRFYIMKWIEKKKVVNPEARNEWKIIPHNWWIKAKQKDKELLMSVSNN
ncbi:MAG: 5'-nucleotidase C-terminal domain-containing protein [Bacteroidales bacterium]|nr:5'-nucleotidase C-terminal domain-containing protein [Bacteroidales bacterium]